MEFEDKIKQRISLIYDKDTAAALVKRIKMLINRYHFNNGENQPEHLAWDEEDVVLITYGDCINRNGRENHKLGLLENFLDEYVGDVINSIHILPFFPSSSDEGFSVIDYKKVRDDLGNWSDIERLANKYRIMVDLVINHTSRYSNWFENYQIRQEPGKDYFIEIDPSTDLSVVMRPRRSPLLTAVKTNNGLKYVWTTFSDDQIDLDFSNPDVLVEFIDIFLFYLSKGVKLVRLDAIAYLWKKVGTKSIHLKETHEVVKLFRDIVDYVNPNCTLITETNVPFEENVSYFGNGDEAHMIYQFSLPPLLLHALLTENTEYLTKWASELPNPPEGCTYFNFTSSHDGIGVRPLEGLVPDEEFDYLVKGAEERGGFISYKQNADDTQSPYELNITYFDAFAEPGREGSKLQLKRYLCSQIVMLSLQGVPGIYFHNLVATENYVDGVAETGQKRSINRRKWSYEELTERLEDESNAAHIVLNFFKKILEVRKQHAAFSPAADQEVLEFGDHLFVLLRTAEEEGEKILVVSNMSSRKTEIPGSELEAYTGEKEELINLINGNKHSVKPELEIEPFETVWLKL